MCKEDKTWNLTPFCWHAILKEIERFPVRASSLLSIKDSLHHRAGRKKKQEVSSRSSSSGIFLRLCCPRQIEFCLVPLSVQAKKEEKGLWATPNGVRALFYCSYYSYSSPHLSSKRCIFCQAKKSPRTHLLPRRFSSLSTSSPFLKGS